MSFRFAAISHDEFKAKMKGFTDNINNFFDKSRDLEKEIKKQLSGLKYE
ncbi:MAG: hypothetical protein ACUZ8O_02085 [Candidatus Anammoxibacter sp.]